MAGNASRRPPGNTSGNAEGSPLDRRREHVRERSGTPVRVIGERPPTLGGERPQDPAGAQCDCAYAEQFPHQRCRRARDDEAGGS